MLSVYQLNAQTYSVQKKNYRVCKEIIKVNDDVSVKTTFFVNNKMSSTEVKTLRNSIYSKSFIYYVGINKKHNEIYVYHMSSIHFEDLKILAGPSGLELNYVTTIPIVFKDESPTTNAIIKEK